MSSSCTDALINIFHGQNLPQFFMCIPKIGKRWFIVPNCFLEGSHIYWTYYDLYSTLHNFALAINLSPIFDALQKVEYWFDMFTFTVIVMKENPISEHILLMSSYTPLKDRFQKLFGKGWDMSRFMVIHIYWWYDEMW